MNITALLSSAVIAATALTSSGIAREAMADASRLPGASDVVMSSVEHFPVQPGDDLRLPAAEI